MPVLKSQRARILYPVPEHLCYPTLREIRTWLASRALRNKIISQPLLEATKVLKREEGRCPGKVANYWAHSIDFLVIALLFTRIRDVERQTVPNLPTKLTTRHVLSHEDLSGG